MTDALPVDAEFDATEVAVRNLSKSWIENVEKNLSQCQNKVGPESCYADRKHANVLSYIHTTTIRWHHHNYISTVSL